MLLRILIFEAQGHVTAILEAKIGKKWIDFKQNILASTNMDKNFCAF